MLTEADKDRIAAFYHDLLARYESGDEALWRGGHPEDRAAEVAMAEFGDKPEELAYYLQFQDQVVARLSERPDPVLDRVDKAIAEGRSEVPKTEEN